MFCTNCGEKANGRFCVTAARRSSHPFRARAKSMASTGRTRVATRSCSIFPKFAT